MASFSWTDILSIRMVADEARKDLMGDCYQRLLKGEGPSGAAEAQRTLINYTTCPHPYY